ncbi:rhomboid family intramembrane serine protease [Synechococcus sp. AH-601-O20]|nr:rhomboid family intramembrane serine protease [Synechococcus sp. AH-601-O20]
MKHQCKDCGSNQVFSDRNLGGRLVCRKCGSFNIGWSDRSFRRNSNIIKPFKSSNINPIDYQYLAVAGALIIVWISSDLLGLISKSQWISWSGMMLDQPHRFLTNALIHMDGRHLLTNLFGIVIGRAILMQLGMRSKYLFALLVAILIPLSSCLQWFWEVIIASNLSAASLGFSGVIYGIDAFLLLCAMKGKDRLIRIPINLTKNHQAQQTMIVLTVIGQIWNLMGGVSVVGHQSGLVAGILLFLL